MDDIETKSSDQDDFNIRGAMLILIKGWWLVLIFSILGGAVGWFALSSVQPNYSAMSTVLVDSEYLDLSNSYPSYILKNDQIQSMVIAQVGEEKFSHVSKTALTNDKVDRSVVFITIVADDPLVAVNVANVWADSAVKWLKQNVDVSAEELSSARGLLEKSNEELVRYLYTNNLNSLTWCDLVRITGNGNCLILTSGMDPNQPLEIKVNQRLDIIRLMQQVDDANLVYEAQLTSQIQKTSAITQRLMVSNYAIDAEPSGGLGKMLLIPAGVMVGFFAAILILAIAHFWRSSRVS